MRCIIMGDRSVNLSEFFPTFQIYVARPVRSYSNLA